MAHVYCARARAPSSSANLGSGFDVLAVAHNLYYDVVTVCVSLEGESRVTVEYVGGPYAAQSGGAVTAKAAVEALLKRQHLQARVWMSVVKGVPPGLGLGSSGATAAAAAYAAYEALRMAGALRSVSVEELVAYAGAGEAVAAGEPHYDNVAASLLGWVAVTARVNGSIMARSFKPRRPIHLAFAIPSSEGASGKTRRMRAILPATLTLSEASAYAGRAALLASALAEGELEEAGRLMMADTIVEPRRAALLPCYRDVVRAALNAGAYGVSLSGAGPSMVALCASKSDAEAVAEAMAEASSKSCSPARPAVALVSPGAELLSAWKE